MHTSHEAGWAGPVRHADLKLAKLDRFENFFVVDRHAFAFRSVTGADDSPGPADPPRRMVKTASVAIATPAGHEVRQEVMASIEAAGDLWVPDRDGRFVWRQAPDVSIEVRTVEMSTEPHLMIHLAVGDRAGSDEFRDRFVRDGIALPAQFPPDADVRPAPITTAAATQPRRVGLDAAVKVLAGRPLVAVTGAGISATSGIKPFIGPQSLDILVGAGTKGFAGPMVTDTVTRPMAVLDALARWHLSFWAAEPTGAHHALADLERRGHLAMTLTTNIDQLHQAAGARRVAEIALLRRVRPPADAGVIVVGSANDPQGVIAQARALGGTVVVINDEVPDWCHSDDLVVLGTAEELVPELADRLTGIRTPLGALDDGRAGPVSFSRSVPGPVDVAVEGVWTALPLIADRVRRRSPSRRSPLHGPRHWLTVAWIGKELAKADPAIDPVVVALFALFHDCRRTHDGHDTEHGRNGAAEAVDMLGDSGLLTPCQLDVLELACTRHTHGLVSDHPTVGACWDADRLDLWRVGAIPDPRLLSGVGRAEPVREWSRLFTLVSPDDVAWDDWRPIALAYQALQENTPT